MEERNIFQNQVWLFGIYDRSEEFFKAFIIRGDRNASNLIPMVLNNVSTKSERKTIIFTDGNPAYNRLSNFNFVHEVIIHERGFGLGQYTTNHIESSWSILKHYSKKFFRGCILKTLNNMRINLMVFYIISI